ncbi:MAG: DNA-binding protein [Gammaproteobacteria bacterium]|nr:MAG: DNA-binding protein [Gammaproteobacteria bacterium]
MTIKQNLISAEQAADYLDVTTRTLANWRSLGFPNIPYSKIGRCIRYRLADLDSYIAKHSHNSMED